MKRQNSIFARRRSRVRNRLAKISGDRPRIEQQHFPGRKRRTVEAATTAHHAAGGEQIAFDLVDTLEMVS